MVERFYGPLTGFEMRPGERGDYVRYSDYAALEAQLAEARKALAESDRQAEKLEALLDPHIAWEGKPAKAYAELTEALQKAKADAARMRAAASRSAALKAALVAKD